MKPTTRQFSASGAPRTFASPAARAEYLAAHRAWRKANADMWRAMVVAESHYLRLERLRK